VPDHLLLNPNHATLGSSVPDELGPGVFPGEPAAGGGCLGLRDEDEQGAVQVFRGGGQTAADSVPSVPVLHLHGSVHRHDLIPDTICEIHPLNSNILQ